MENLYDAPKAELIDKPLAPFGPPFFVTSTRKLCVLYLCTFGYYTLYWSFKQWFSQRRSAGYKVLPAARGLFYIFFVHSLSALISKRLMLMERPSWRYDSAPTWLVGLVVLGWVVNGFERYGAWSQVVAMPLIVLVLVAKVLPLIGMQRQANLASGDPAGQSNDAFSGWNWFFVVPGALIWVMATVGFVLLALGS
ncbi:MFS transporter permease [Pseudomonas turukhanskensis]|uniref:MFS transporter permease n=1 Tax=Pseudomonas turukhanskensis TaxID=1806536 RepID=A0A9W6K5W0_9PSED|nr:MFS transporter permease [Pseudomonas turukhanskensis]GLK89372.1 hypothetical protein GCM10017655_24340 [Pseudomonas turukhanskensis]